MESKNNLSDINLDDDFPLDIREAADQSAVADFIEESKTFEELVLALKVYFGLDDEYYEERAKFKASSLMVKQGGSSGHNEDIARLDGARLVTSSEPNEGVRLDEGLIKQLTGGDKVSASFKGGHMFDYKPKYKIWLATNHKPIIRGNDDGIWRRLPLIPFTVQIPLDKVDKTLKEKLMRELSGIMNWAVEGCLAWQREGLNPPADIQKATMEYRQEMDVIGSFIEQCCETGPGYSIGATELFKAYDKWAKEMNEHGFTQTQFGKKVSDKFTKEKKGKVRYLGIGLKKAYREFSVNVPGL